MTGGILGFVLFLVLVPLLVNEAQDIAPWVAARLLRWGARRLGPADKAERYEEEWLAELDRVQIRFERFPGRLAKLGYACSVLVWTVPRLRRQFRQEVWLSAVLLDRMSTYRFHHGPISASGNRVSLRMRNSRALSSDLGLALVHVGNCGRCGIEADDFKWPLSITFEGRDIISAGVTEFSSPDMESRIHDGPGVNIDGSTVVLPKIPLNSGERFTLLVVLSGTGSGVTGTSLRRKRSFHAGSLRGCDRDRRGRQGRS